MLLQRKLKQMAGEKKQTEPHQAELDKYRILLQTMLDYHLEHYIGSMVFDQWDPSAEHYLQQKQQAEKDFQDRRLDKLQQVFGRLVESLSNRRDTNFERHLKEKTGYDIGSIEDWRKNTAAIDVRNENGGMPIPECTIIVEVDTRGIPLVKVSDMEQYFSTKPAEFNFPDCIRRVMVRSNGTGKSALTEVSIVLKGGSGCIYCVAGENLPIKAFWKDKNTVVIETKNEYDVSIRHDRVSSFDDIIKIEYVESLL